MAVQSRVGSVDGRDGDDREAFFGLRVGSRAGDRAPAVIALALAVLCAVFVVDFALPRRYVLIGYYGLAPLIGAASLGPMLTTGLGAIAVGAAFAAGTFDDLGVSHEVLRTGVVVFSAVVATFVSATRVRRERRLRAVSAVAEAAQQAVLRRLPDHLPGLTLASAYHSASAQARVGGDLYEALAVPDGARLLIGDVRGKGLPAVQLAGTVTGAFRHAALADVDLATIADGLDVTVTQFTDDEEFVTALLVETTNTDELRVVCCGHHPPLLGPPGRLIQAALTEVGLPLGLGGTHRTETLRWRPRDLLLLYTDGLVEARDTTGRMLDLPTIATAVNDTDPATCLNRILTLVSRHTAGRLDDDLALLLARREPVTQPPSHSVAGVDALGDHG